MDQLKSFFTTRTALALIVIGILLAGLVGGVYLSQRPTQLKSKAAQPTYGSISVSKSSINKVGSNWESVPIIVNISVPGADNSKTVAGVYITKTENVSAGTGWTAIGKFYGSNGADSFSWTPPSSYGDGSYTLGFFFMNQNTVLDLIQTSSAVSFSQGGQPTSPCQTSNWQLSNQSPSPNTKVDVTVQGSGNVIWQNVQLRDKGVAVCGVGTNCELSSYPPSGPTIRTLANLGINSAAAGSRHNLTITVDNGAVTCSGSASFTTSSPSSTGGTGVVDAAECKSVVFKKDGQSAPSLFENQKYDVEITMDNKDYNNSSYQGPTWTVGNLSAGTGYFIGFPTAGDTGAGDFKINVNTAGTDLSINSLWQVNWTDPAKLRIPLGTNITAGGSYPFKFTVTPQKAGTHTFYWSMVHEGVNWFGGECTSQITVAAAGSTPPVCAQVVTKAKNSTTGECKDFPTSCLDSGWVADPNCTPSATTGNDVAGACEHKLLDIKTLNVAKDIISGLQYKLQIIMKNVGKSTWGIDTYFLKPSTKTISDWGVSPIALKDSLLGQSVAPNGPPATFEFTVTGPALKVADQPESRSFSFQMANGASEFGAACQTGAITILPKTAAPNATACFILSANQSEVTSVTTCNDLSAKALGIVHPYPSDPTQLSYKLIDTSAGVKNIYVRFISTKGETADGFGQITFAPDPTVSAIACTQSATGTGTIVALAGTNFGSHSQQGIGGVTVNGTQAQIVTWDPVKGLIQATVPTRLEGTLNIDLKVDDGRTVTGGKCTIGTSSVQFTVGNQCVAPGVFNINDVDATIVQNVTGAKPLIQTKINVSKGVPQNFTPKLEANKNYSLILKGLRTLVKRVDFTTDQGTVNLGNIQFFIGDIAPVSAPDGVINNFDNSEMIRQWSLLSSGSSTAKTASLTEHETPGIVNSLDYSCLKLGIGKQNDDLTLATTTTTTTTTTSTNRAIPVKGKVYLDSNSNNAFDTGETLLSGVSVKALYPAAVQTPGQTLTPAQAAAATVLGTATTDANGNYSSTFIAPVGILNLVMWVDPGSSTGQGGQDAVGIGAITDTALQQNPLTMDVAVKP